MSLTDELLGAFEPQIESVRLIPSGGGCFEVTVDGALIYSKLATGRHADPGEIAGIVRSALAR